MKHKTETDSFIEEIKEDLKNDNLKKLWDKFGAYIIFFMAGVLLLTVLFESYKFWQEKKNQELVNVYTYALNLEAQKKYDESLKILENFSDTNMFLKNMAEMESVNILLLQNKRPEALALLNKIITTKSTDSQIRDLAIIKLASYMVDESSFEDMQKLLTPVLKKGGAWQLNAKEYLALSALHHNNKEQAKALYTEIADAPNVQDSLKTRSFDMLSVLEQ